MDFLFARAQHELFLRYARLLPYESTRLMRANYTDRHACNASMGEHDLHIVDAHSVK